jgi:hypothetical protein
MAIEKINNNIVNEILSSDLHGKRIYLLGTAEFGPTNKPMLINNEGHLNSIFGFGGSIIEAYSQIKEGSSNSEVYVCKVTGTHSIAHLNVNIVGSDIVEDGFIIKSKESNEIYNNIKINLYPGSIEFVFPEELGGGTKEYLFENYNIFGLLVKAINEDTDNELNFVYAQCIVDPATPLAGSLACCNPSEMYMYGGDSGIYYCKNQYYYALQETYDLLESEEIDIIVPAEAFMDDVHPEYVYYGQDGYNQLYYQEDRDYLTIKIDNKPVSFYTQLLEFCVRQLRFGMVTNGVIGFNKTYNKHLYSDEQDYVVNIVKASLEYNLKITDYKNMAFLVSVVAGDLSYNYGDTVNNGYSVYAGLISSLSVKSNTTNIPLPESISVFNEFSEDAMKILSDLGVVTFRISPFYDRPVVYSGVTPVDKDKTDLHLYCNVRMIQLTISYVRKLLESYIGENIDDLVSSGIMRKELEYVLDTIRDRGVIDSYEAEIVIDNTAGELSFYLILQTIYMLEGIEVSGGFSFEAI